MEFFNFSEEEIDKTRKALRFVSRDELDPAMIPSNLPIIKSDKYQTDCDQFIDPERTVGTENNNAVVIFPNNRTSTHKLFLNSEQIEGISYIHSLTGELVTLANFAHYFKENGHLYTFTPEKQIGQYYYEFLLWVKFLSRKISTRTYTLMSWHEVNGEQPPKDGRYTFQGISVRNGGVIRSLESLAACDSAAALLEVYWEALGQLALYFGELSFYQNEPAPAELDPGYPEALLDKHLGSKHLLEMYRLLQQTRSYDLWKETRAPLRKCILAMEKQCKEVFTAEASAE